ncbi:MAG TPA: dienelactone hydrolase family protein [Longimicrobiales bacterium]|nr:dienelactone hydrolase family protein [Longimicrobiales bacterium]
MMRAWRGARMGGPECDNRDNATIGRSSETHTFAGAGHGFTRSQDARDGANRAAVEQAWPLTVEWFRRQLGGEPEADSHRAN